MRNLFLLIAVSLVSVASGAAAYACSCLPVAIEKEYQSAHKVAIAKAVHVRKYINLKGNLREHSVFKVKKTYKGSQEKFITINDTLMHSCAFSFNMSTDYVLWLKPASEHSPGTWNAYSCGRTTGLEWAQDQIQWLEEHANP